MSQEKIYLIQRIGFPTYKIGHTKDLHVRMRNITREFIRDGLFNDGSPVMLDLIYSFNLAGAPYRAEPSLHRYFRDQRIEFEPPCILPHREWFTLTDAHVAFFITLTDDSYLDLISIGKEIDE